jgi:hypothetical protein
MRTASAMVRANQFDRYHLLVPPADQPRMKALINAMTRVNERARKLAPLVSEKIGPEQGERMARCGRLIEFEALRGIDFSEGALAAEKPAVVFKIEPENASFTVNGGASGFDLVVKEGRWWLTPAVLKTAGKPDPQADAMIKALDAIEQGINDGSITAKNYQRRELNLMTAQLMSG